MLLLFRKGNRLCIVIVWRVFFVFNHCHGVFSWLESLTWCSLSIQIPTLVKFIDLKHRLSEVYQFESLSLWSLSIWHLVLVRFIDLNPCLGEVYLRHCLDEVYRFKSLPWWSLLIWILILVKFVDLNPCLGKIYRFESLSRCNISIWISVML